MRKYRKKKIIINIYIIKLSLDNEYIQIKAQKKLFNVLNIKNFIKITDLQNQKKINVLIKKQETFYL